MKEFSEEKDKYFASVDGEDHVTLIALDPEDRDDIIVIVLRYDREQREQEKAEYATLVEDSRQGQGVRIALTRKLVDEAKGKGVRRFYAVVMGKDRRMSELLRRLDLPGQEHKEKGVNHVEVELSSLESLDERDRGTEDI
jgi:GNAT superfamily N-acetyltransferase